MKKVLIVYETLHGSSEKCAFMLKDQINHETRVARLKDNEDIDISGYDILVIGGSIHMGVLHTRVKNFVEKNFELLMQKPHGLFLCCIEQGDTARFQFENAYPEKLRKSSIVNGLFGGEFNFKKMNLFDRTFTKKVAKVNSSISKINLEEIQKFAREISR